MTQQCITTSPFTDAAHRSGWHLVQLVQNGDTEAFGTIYDQYADTIFRFLIVRVRDRELAEDLTSETFVRALRSIASISYQGRDVGAWLVTIARNLVLDHVKSARNRLETTTDVVDFGGASELSAETRALARLTRADLLAAVQELTDKQRECVTFRFVLQMSTRETAAAMNTAENAVKSLQHRALRSLAAILEQQGVLAA